MRDPGERRQISQITWKHLEQVISAMILSSTCNSSDPVESTPANSLVTQPSYREVEEVEPKQTPKVGEKQVIVNNYYISDKESGWKQLQEGEIPPNRSEATSRRTSGEILANETMQCQKKHPREDTNKQNLNIIWKTGPMETDTIEEAGRYHVEEAETQNMAPPPTCNFDYPPQVKPTGVLDTSSMLDCIHQLQLTLQQHILTNSKQTEYHMSQNADLFTEMIKGQIRRDLDLAVMAIPTFTGQEPEKCLDGINRIRNICSQAGHSLHQELMNKSEPVVQNFIRTMGDMWTDEEVIEEILKYFSDIPTPAHAITKLRALIQGEDEAIVTYNQKYRTLIERVEGKLVEKINSYVKLEQYLGRLILPIRKSIRSNIYWKSKHAPKTLGEAMRKVEELYVKHIYTTGGWITKKKTQLQLR